MLRIIVSVFLLKRYSIMKKWIGLFFVVIAIESCKDQTSKTEAKSTAQKITEAYGIENWNTVNELHFTFNVDRDTNHFERSFIWKPKTQDISFFGFGDTLHFKEHKIDSLSLRAHKNFVNDSYWLLAPFHIMWDSGTTISEEESAIAPISGKTLHKLTLTYGNEGGYTPGDAYDFYYNKEYIIEEWAYRQGNQDKISMTTSWSNIEAHNGVKMNTMHQDSTNTLKLYFTNLLVK